MIVQEAWNIANRRAWVDVIGPADAPLCPIVEATFKRIQDSQNQKHPDRLAWMQKEIPIGAEEEVIGSLVEKFQKQRREDEAKMQQLLAIPKN